MATTSTKKKNILIAKIESRADALKTIKDSSATFVVIGIIQGVIGFLLSPWALVDAALFIIMGLVLMFLHSRIAAVLLLLLSGASIVVTFMNILGISAEGGTNIILAVLVFWAAIRAVEATFKLHGRFARQPGGFGPDEYVLPDEFKHADPHGFSLDELMQSDERQHAEPRFSTLEQVLIGLVLLLIVGLAIVVVLIVG